MREMKLLPFEVNEIMDNTEKIPEGIQLMKAPAVWEESKRGQGVVVAILDTGCQVNHLDLKDRIIGGRNFTTDDFEHPDIYNDYNGHGTYVAGTIAASENAQGLVGMAPPGKPADSEGTGPLRQRRL